MTIEERLVDIETKIAFQENTVQELNQLVYQHQKQLDQLEAALKTLAGRVEELSDTMAIPPQADEKPPHY